MFANVCYDIVDKKSPFANVCCPFLLQSGGALAAHSSTINLGWSWIMKIKMMIVMMIITMRMIMMIMKITFEKPLSATGWSQWLQVRQSGCHEAFKAWLIVNSHRGLWLSNQYGLHVKVLWGDLPNIKISSLLQFWKLERKGKEEGNLEHSANYELWTLGAARGKQNLQQILFWVHKIQEPGSRAGNTCAPQTQRRPPPRRVESTGRRRSTWNCLSCRQFEEKK